MMECKKALEEANGDTELAFTILRKRGQASAAKKAGRTAAEGLTGLYCTVPLAAARRLPADHYYHFQLVGLSVFDARRQRSLGRVEEVLSYAANDVLRVADGQREVLVPMLKSVVRGIEPDRGIIMVDLPDEAEP